MPETEHRPLPDGEWWACAEPERPSEGGRTHYRPGCRRCWPAFLASAAKPNHRFVVDGVEKMAYALDDRLRDWFMSEGEFEKESSDA